MSAANFVPKSAFLTAGVGHARHPLAAFDAALRDAGVSHLNLVPVSSVFPPDCQLIEREEGLKSLPPGAVTFVVMARHESSVPGTRIAAAIGLARPADAAQYGYLAEHHMEGQEEEDAKNFVEKLAIDLLAAKLGVPREAVATAITTGIARSATIENGDLWTSVVALCVFGGIAVASSR